VKRYEYRLTEGRIQIVGSRWIFTEDHSAIQVCHITELKIGKTGHSVTPYSVVAHMTGPRIVQVAQFDTYTDAEDAIKDMVVGREHRRS
jgi:hypothetical protein